MKAVVSGANGFIGKYLVNALAMQGIPTVPIPREKLLAGDALKKFFDKEQPDYIFHLSAYGNHSRQTDVKEIIKVNYVGTLDMLMSSMQVDYKAFINVSSSSVLLPHETMYSATKAGAERLCNVFVHEYGRPVVTVRPYSVYGVGEGEHRFIPMLFKSGLEGVPIPFAREAVHDWIYVTDLVRGLILTAENAEKVMGKPVDFGTGIASSNQLVRSMVEKITKKPTNIEAYRKMRSFDTKEWVADIKTAVSIGWKPRVFLKDGLHLIYDDILRQRKGVK